MVTFWQNIYAPSRQIVKVTCRNLIYKSVRITFLLVACGGVSKNDVIEVCSTISSSYVDSQLRQGIFKEDPRFRNLLIKLR